MAAFYPLGECGCDTAMISVSEYRDRVLALVSPNPAASTRLEEGLGLALASDVVAPLALPPFDNSAMDGYAVRYAEVTASPCELKVTQDIAAGSGIPLALDAGTAARIMTGAPVPDGADAVIPVEWTDAGTTTVRIERAPKPGANIRRTGEDVEPGTTVLHAGDELTPAAVGVVAALGLPAVHAHRRPRVGVLSTGSELTAPGEALPDGSIYDSNAPLLAACVRRLGADVVTRPFVADDVASAKAVMSELAAEVDLLVTSGGISAGAYEVVKDVLDHQVEFVKVAMQPGMPQGCGRFAGCPVITLPGNPVSVFVSFELFVRPAVRRLGGHRVLDRPLRRAKLAEPVRRRPEKQQYLRVTWADAESVRPVGGTGSHLLTALAHADGLAVIPPGDDEAAAGDWVDVIDIRP